MLYSPGPERPQPPAESDVFEAWYANYLPHMEEIFRDLNLLEKDVDLKPTLGLAHNQNYALVLTSEQLPASLQEHVQQLRITVSRVENVLIKDWKHDYKTSFESLKADFIIEAQLRGREAVAFHQSFSQGDTPRVGDMSHSEPWLNNPTFLFEVKKVTGQLVTIGPVTSAEGIDTLE